MLEFKKMTLVIPLHIKTTIVGYLLSCLVIFTSCTASLDRKEFIKWVEDYKNGLHVQKATDEFIFDLQYQPSQYLSLQRNTSGVLAKNDEDNLQHYTLTVSARDNKLDFMDYGTHDFSEKQRKLYYFSYLFQNDIHVEENGTIMPCVLFHFERQADLKHGRTFVLAFEKSTVETNETYVVINSDQFGSLPIKIKVLKENIPALKP